MPIRQVSLEVFQAEGPVVRVHREDLRPVREGAARSPRRRSRICAHPGPQDPTQEMINVLARDTIVRPHIHPGRVESFHVVEGLLTVVLFEDDGRVMDTVPMGEFRSGRSFFYRMTRPLYHTTLPESDFVALHEVTQGPFTREGTVFAGWSPAEGPDGALRDWLLELRRRVGALA
ncbi:MAG: cupin fold metalloprotein, WbuC family [Planctomycetes bacterium]|nr:cupin fold metalloprotein, WbuC family [Planctomycetota bacterium]